MAHSCERDNETSGAIKCPEILEQLSDYNLVIKAQLRGVQLGLLEPTPEPMCNAASLNTAVKHIVQVDESCSRR